ncbi:MAG: hypothetical protein ACLFNN_00130 [Candidatus Paceibacterota bacterium]
MRDNLENFYSNFEDIDDDIPEDEEDEMESIVESSFLEANNQTFDEDDIPEIPDLEEE